MDSELKILQKIWQNQENSSVRLISNQTRLGIDYTRYICNCLFKKDQIKPVKGKRDCYKITAKGKKELKLAGIIKLKVARKTDDLEKVVYYFPKRFSAQSKSVRAGKTKQLKNDLQKVISKSKSLKSKLIETEEKKLNLGRSIEKAVAFLKRSIKEEK